MKGRKGDQAVEEAELTEGTVLEPTPAQECAARLRLGTGLAGVWRPI